MPDYGAKAPRLHDNTRENCQRPRPLPNRCAAFIRAAVLACRVLAAGRAFLLCRYVGARYAPALVGGYIFGFSPYVLAHIYVGHLTLLPIFPVPLAVLLFALRLDDAIGESGFVAAFALVIVVQFLFAVALVAAMFFFALLLLALASLFSSPHLLSL